MVAQVNGVKANGMYSVTVRRVSDDVCLYSESGVMGCDLPQRIPDLVSAYGEVGETSYVDVIDSDGNVIDW
jgi:hypothetical protein